MNQPYALLSVTDKTGLTAFAQGLVALGYRLLSTGGTGRALTEAGVPFTQVADFTGHPEILGGRVKTLHPKIHGGLLADWTRDEHRAEAEAHDLVRIAVLAVNLYAFEEVCAAGGSASERLEAIDIGGPAMLRAGAKNHTSVTVICDPRDYATALHVLEEAQNNTENDAENNAKNKIKSQARLRAYNRRQAAQVFHHLAAYDQRVAAELAIPLDDWDNADRQAHAAAFGQLTAGWQLQQSLRYGENPQQRAVVVAPSHQSTRGFAAAEVLQGKELSYNNLLDLDAALGLLADLDYPSAAVVIKHTNPCGVAVGDDAPVGVLGRALEADAKSAFGGIVALRSPLDEALAGRLVQGFLECVIAPEVTSAALATLARKPNLRVVRLPMADWCSLPQLRTIAGAALVQTPDVAASETWTTVTDKAPSAEELADLRFAAIVAKHAKSNAIVCAAGGGTVGIGAGQVSRIDAVHHALQRAQATTRTPEQPIVLASDAFFPFPDSVQAAAAAGVTAIVQPGGSKRDAESVVAANDAGIAMVFTGVRHFRH